MRALCAAILAFICLSASAQLFPPINGGGGGSGSVTHVAVVASTGINVSGTCSSGSVVNCSVLTDPSVIPTHDTIHNNEVWVNSTTGSTAYVGSLAGDGAVLSALQAGQAFMLTVDTTCSTNCSLRIDSLPASPRR